MQSYNLREAEKELARLKAQGNRNFPRYDIFDRINEKAAEVHELRQELIETQNLLEGRKYDPHLFEMQGAYDDYTKAVDRANSLKGELDREFSGNFLREAEGRI